MMQIACCVLMLVARADALIARLSPARAPQLATTGNSVAAARTQLLQRFTGRGAVVVALSSPRAAGADTALRSVAADAFASLRPSDASVFEQTCGA